MNQQPTYYPSLANPQKYPGKPTDPVEEQRVPERRCFGFTLSIFWTIVGILISFASISGVIYGSKKIAFILTFISGIFIAHFHISAMREHEYLGGQPGLQKFLSLFTGIFCFFLGFHLNTPIALNAHMNLKNVFRFRININTPNFLGALLWILIFSGFSYFIYSQDDDSGSCFLSFKPWNLKLVPQMNFSGYGYPLFAYPQPTYPQGHPQQQYENPPKV